MPRILIVDDEKENREALERALGDVNADWQLFSAENDIEGISVVNNSTRQKGTD